MPEQFEAHSRTFALMTIVSRISGLARDAVLGRIFGGGAIMSAFFFAFLIPNLFRRLFGEGALAAAFLPAYARLQQTDPATAGRLATLTLGGLIGALGAVTLFGEGLLWMIWHYAPHQHLAVRLMMIMLPYMPLVCVVAILGAISQVHGRFGPPSAAPIVLNIALIAAAVAFGACDPDSHITAVAVAVLIAGVGQVMWMLWALRPRRWLHLDCGTAGSDMRRVLTQAGPMILGLGVLQLNTFLDGVIASYPVSIGPSIFGRPYPLDEGAMTFVSFAQRLYQFPLGVFGLAVATAIFPALARHAGDDEAFAALLRRGLRLSLFVGLPASCGLVLVGRPLAAVIFEGHLFTAADSGRVAFVLLGYASAVWAYSLIHVLTRAFYAKGDSRRPVRVAVAMVGLNLALNVTLIWTPLKEAGLAWSTATCATLQAAVLLWLVRRHTRRVLGGVLVSWLKTAVATGAMVASVLGVQAIGGRSGSWAASLADLLVAVGVGVVIFSVVARMLAMEELRWVIGRKNQVTK